MQIQSSSFPFRLPLLPPSDRAVNTGADRERPQRPTEESPSPPVAVEPLQTNRSAESSARSARAEFFSMHRDLPLSSLNAISTYLDTDQFQTPAGSGEWVGVDIYV